MSSKDKGDYILPEHNLAEWNSIRVHAALWFALAKSPDPKEREQALKEYPPLFEKVKDMLVALTDMSRELRHLMYSITGVAVELVDDRTREKQNELKTFDTE